MAVFVDFNTKNEEGLIPVKKDSLKIIFNAMIAEKKGLIKLSDGNITVDGSLLIKGGHYYLQLHGN